MSPVAARTRPQLVIFDLDGTLTDSADGIVASFRHALIEVGADLPEGDLVGRIVGPPIHHTMAALGLGHRVDDAVAAYRADYTSRGWAMNTVFDGVTELLSDLRDAGVRLAVFNDAGIGKDGAGIAALALLQTQGVAACAVAHDSARIGEARSTLDDGVVSCTNEAAARLGARAGQRLRDWLAPQPG